MGLDIEEIKNDLLNSVAGVEDVHHLHAWSLTATRDVMTLHARIAEGVNPDQVLAAINDRLRHKFQIDHATVQIETAAYAH